MSRVNTAISTLGDPDHSASQGSSVSTRFRHALPSHPYHLLGVVFLVAVFSWGDLWHIGGPNSSNWWANLGWTLCCLPAIAGCIRAGRRGGPGDRSWWCFAAGCAVWLAGQLAWDYYTLVAQITPTYPSLADVGYLGFVPCFLVGLFLLPRHSSRHRIRLFLLFDLSICVLALTLTGIIADQDLLIGTTMLSRLGQAVALAYPVTYITLGLGTFLLMVQVPHLAATRGIPWLVGGLFCEGAAFIAWVPTMLNYTFTAGTALDILWMIGLLAIGLAGLEWKPITPTQSPNAIDAPALSLVILGLLPTILGTVIALVVPALAIKPVAEIVTLGARALIILIALRQIAGVVEHTRLFRAEVQQRTLAQQRSERLRRIQDVGHALRLDLDVAAIGRLIVDTICPSLGFRMAILNLIDDSLDESGGPQFRPVATAGLEPDVSAHFLRQKAPISDMMALFRAEFRISRSYFIPAVRARALLNDTQIPVWTPPIVPVSTAGWQPGDELLIPLFATRSDDLIGFLAVDDPTDGNRPDVEIVETLEILADQTALALQNARLFGEAHHRTQRSEAVGALLHALGHHLEVNALLHTGLQGIIHLTGANSASLFEYEAATRTLIRRAGEGMISDMSIGYRVPLEEEYHAMQALHTRTPVLLTAPRTPTEQAALDRLGCRTILAVPLITGGQPSGIIFINYKDNAPAASTEERRFVQEMADALAVALEKAMLYERAHTQAMRDPVTDLANHRAVHQALDAALAPSSSMMHEPTTLLLIDVDNFKLFNDTYGHPTGDAVLRVIAAHLKSGVREGSLAGRYGGDEFAVVLPNTDRASGERVAQRITHAVASRPHVTPDGAFIPLSVSIGVATSPEDGLTRQALLAVADARMYTAKRGLDVDQVLLRSAADLLGETTFGVLEGLVSAVDAKDRYTREHSLDVTRYALLLADALHLDEQARRTLSIAGPLHDVGKIAVPDRILRKPSALTAEEYTTIKAHVTYGVAIVRGVLDDDDVLAAIAHHHERYDGRGYPQGISGEHTPLLGRIMQIADAVSAMTLDRPYRRGLSPDRLIAELRRGAGSQFDPHLVEVFIAVFMTLHPPHQQQPDAADPLMLRSS